MIETLKELDKIFADLRELENLADQTVRDFMFVSPEITNKARRLHFTLVGITGYPGLFWFTSRAEEMKESIGD